MVGVVAYRDKRCTVCGDDGKACRDVASWTFSDSISYYYSCNEHFEKMAKSGLSFRRCSDEDGTNGEHGPAPFNI